MFLSLIEELSDTELFWGQRPIQWGFYGSEDTLQELLKHCLREYI
ncbi:unnamed protein product [Brassica rapa subsp. narinosa]